MTVRAKFKVQSIERVEAYGGEAVTIKMGPVYSSSPDSENHAFWKATPSGNIILSVINPEAAAQFELGKEYYIDFTLTPAKELAQV
jgi:hypothetical protein